MVSTSAPATTITVLRKNGPIDAPPQARTKLSARHSLGSSNGVPNTSSFGLNAVMAAHSSGSTDTSAHTANVTWKNASVGRHEPRALTGVGVGDSVRGGTAVCVI